MHFLQSEYWRECKKRLGNEIIDLDNSFIQVNTLPFNLKVGYLPRVDLEKIDFLRVFEKCRENNLQFVTVDLCNLQEGTNKKASLEYLRAKFPKIRVSVSKSINPGINTVLKLTTPLEELQQNMDKMHRYSIRVSEKRGVVTSESDNFNEFAEIYLETARDQKYSARSEKYVKTVWETLRQKEKEENRELVKIFTAKYNNAVVASAMFFLFDGVIYYSYSGSKKKFRNLNPNYNLIWEVIKWGKEHGYAQLDFWGIKKDKNGKLNGYSKFKTGWGGEIITYQSSFDIVISSKIYAILKLLQNIRKFFLFGAR